MESVPRVRRAVLNGDPVTTSGFAEVPSGKSKVKKKAAVKKKKGHMSDHSLAASACDPSSDSISETLIV